MVNRTTHRPERIASVIKRAVSVIIESEISDPRIHGVDVTDVVMSRDYRYATVFVSIDGDDESVLKALDGSAGYIRRVLAEQLIEMRGIPLLKFQMDKSGSYYKHIDDVIKGLHDNENNE